MNKKELREETKNALDQFFKSGGQVTVCKPAKKKVKHPATGHQKMAFFEKAPPIRIASSWGLVDGRF